MATLNSIATTLSRLSKIDNLDEFMQYGAGIPGGDTRTETALMRGISTTKSIRLPAYKTNYGYTFFTRPMLALISSNLRNNPAELGNLLSTRNDVYSWARRMLDPRIHANRAVGPSPLVDEQMAFIPVLSNTLINISGWPDEILPTHTSKEGIRGEQHTMVDGIMEINRRVDIDATFRNIPDQPVLVLIKAWTMAAQLTHEFMAGPYTDFIRENELNYNTRIYRIVLDEYQEKIVDICATGASTPVAINTGQMFDYDMSSPFNDSSKELRVRFSSDGVMYHDPALLLDFNKTQAMFNANIRALMRGEPTSLEKIPKRLLPYFSNRCYPYINLNSGQLEWYVDKDTVFYKRFIEIYSNVK